MASIRNRFTPAERTAFTKGTKIEYLNVNRWYPGTITSGIKTRDDGQQYLTLERDHKLTRTMLAGQISILPKHVRLPEEKRTGKYV